jgi:hypothetical protein
MRANSPMVMPVRTGMGGRVASEVAVQRPSPRRR